MSPKSKGRTKAVRGRPRPVPVRKSRGSDRPGTRREQPLPPTSDGLSSLIDRTSDALLLEADRFRSTLTDVDPLKAELYAAQMLAGLSPTGAVGNGIGLGVVAVRHPEPHVAAMVDAVHSLLANMPTSEALRQLSYRGVPLPPWHSQLHEVTVGRAWHCQDVFGERETVLLSFFYGEREHAFLVETTRSPNQQIQLVRIADTATELLDTLESSEEISPQQARATLEPALEYATDPDTDPADVTLLPVLAHRVRHLPETESEPAEPVRYTRGDRATAVEEFLADTGPVTGVDDDTLRFWAEVMVGFTAVHHCAPTRIGPLWLGGVFAVHVPGTFELNSVRRAALLPAVTAWTTWAGRRNGLPAAAVAQLEASVVEIARTYDAVHDDPKWLPIRSYLSDAAELTRDGEDLMRVQRRRSQAVPIPAQRPTAGRSLLASDPAQRRQIVLDIINDEQDGQEYEFSSTFEAWRDAYLQISEDLWNDTWPELSELVLAYLDGEAADGYLLSELAEIAMKYPGDPDGFLNAARSELATPDDEV